MLFFNFCLFKCIVSCLLAPSAAPDDVKAENITDSSAVVTWSSLPQAYHNGKLQGYEIRVKSLSLIGLFFFNESHQIHDPTDTSYQVVSLPPFQHYQVQLAAVNDAQQGRGPWSKPYNFKTKSGG